MGAGGGGGGGKSHPKKLLLQRKEGYVKKNWQAEGGHAIFKW